MYINFKGDRVEFRIIKTQRTRSWCAMLSLASQRTDQLSVALSIIIRHFNLPYYYVRYVLESGVHDKTTCSFVLLVRLHASTGSTSYKDTISLCEVALAFRSPSVPKMTLKFRGSRNREEKTTLRGDRRKCPHRPKCQ